MTLQERFQQGIKRYGYDSDFRRDVETILNRDPVDKQALLKCFEHHSI
jgi:hypothetical protein